MPKCPRSSGPVRNELGCGDGHASRPSQASADVGCARGADEGADFVRILFARRALDAGRHIDAGRAGDAQRLGDIAGVEPARQHEWNCRIDALEQASSRTACRARPAASRPAARAHRRSAGRRPWRRARIGDRSVRSAIGSAFITGRPKRVRNAATRSGVSLPCSCSMSGLSASTMPASVSSLASTVSATLPARPCTRCPSARAASSARLRGLGGKNTKPTMSAPDSSATSSASGVFRPQILTINGMAGVLAAFAALAAKRNRYGMGGGMTGSGGGSDGKGWPRYMSRAFLRSSSACKRPHLGTEPAGAAPPLALAEPGGTPPISTPMISTAKISTNSGRVAA